jgi:hypothetical protein
MHGEITYDLVMEDDMDFVEGCYRILPDDWRVIIVSKCAINSIQRQECTWGSGVKGFFILVPKSTVLNRDTTERLLTEATGVATWRRVPGPDSMQVR